MGCFSFKCKKCNEPILSNSYRGQKVILFLLKEGEVIESMTGEYDSYGRVFAKDLEGSITWQKEWDEVCKLIFDKDKSNGIAAIHSKCSGAVIPNTRSEDDPNQGWGEDGELFSDTDNSLRII